MAITPSSPPHRDILLRPPCDSTPWLINPSGHQSLTSPPAEHIMGVHFAPVASHPKGMYVPVHCFFTDSQLCRHRSSTTHPWAHPADGAGRSQLQTQEECCQCPQPLRHHREGASGSPVSLTVELVTAPVSRLSAGHQHNRAGMCQCAGHHLFQHTTSCQNTTVAKTPQMQKHCRCKNTTVAKTLQMPKHRRCQNTTDAKTPH